MVAVTHRTARQMVYPPRTRTRQARPLRGRTTKRALLKAKAHLISLGLSSCPYSPKCVELEFSEVRREGVFRSLSPNIVSWRTDIPLRLTIYCPTVTVGKPKAGRGYTGSQSQSHSRLPPTVSPGAAING